VTEAPRKQELRNAILEWQQKHNIADDDPLLATVELWEAFLESERSPDASSPDIRRDIEQLDRIAKSFSKQTGEVIRELRAVPKIKSDLWMFPYFTVVLVSVGALIAGMIIGKFML
jgi:hypothetical protein